MSHIAKSDVFNGRSSYLETLIAKKRGHSLNRNDVDYSVENQLSNTNKIQILFIYLVIPVIVTIILYFMMYSNPLGWLYSLVSGLMFYIFLVYTYPIPLDSVFNEWVLTDKKILFSKNQKIISTLLPFNIIVKNNDQEIMLSDIVNVELTSKTNGFHMENSFSLGPWSPKISPSLQTEYILTIKIKDGTSVNLSGKNSDLILNTILKFLNLNIDIIVN